MRQSRLRAIVEGVGFDVAEVVAVAVAVVVAVPTTVEEENSELTEARPEEERDLTMTPEVDWLQSPSWE